MPTRSLQKNPRAEFLKRQWSHGLALTLSALTLLLVVAGALVTGTGSSLAVPDWPLSYGQLFPPMVGGIFYEHGHRMIAATVGLFTVGLCGWLWWVEERRWVRLLALGAVGLVILQGVLGGITVLLLLPKPISIGHAMLGQLFFLLTVLLAQATSPGWERLVPGRQRAEPGRTGLWSAILAAAILLQLGLGATVRHNEAGLAIPDFPLAYGALVPPLTSFSVAVHFFHRVGAVAVVVLVGIVLWQTRKAHREQPALVTPAMVLAFLVAVQVVLGGISIWSRLAVPVTTLHVATGALLLGGSGLLAFRGAALENPPRRRA